MRRRKMNREHKRLSTYAKRKYDEMKIGRMFRVCDDNCNDCVRRAVRNGHIGCVMKIVNGDHNRRNRPHTPNPCNVELSVAMGNPVMLYIFITGGYPIFDTYMETAVHENSHHCFELLCQTNAQMVDAGIVAASKGYARILYHVYKYRNRFTTDYTVLETAIKYRQYDCIKICLHELDNISNIDARATVTRLVKRDDLKILSLVLTSAHFSVEPNDMCFAICNKSWKCVKMLLGKTSIPNEALALAIESKFTRCVRELSRRGARLYAPFTEALLDKSHYQQMFKIVWDFNRSQLTATHVQYLHPVFKKYTQEIADVTKIPIDVANIVFNYC